MGTQNISPSLDEVPSSFVQFAVADKLINLCRANSLWPLTFGIACCAIEMMATGAARFDLSRFGAEVFRPSARQSDLMIVAGTISKKMAPGIKTLYDQMPEPKWVIALGNCAISGGPFVYEGQYAIVEGADSKETGLAKPILQVEVVGKGGRRLDLSFGKLEEAAYYLSSKKRSEVFKIGAAKVYPFFKAFDSLRAVPKKK